MKGKDDGRTPVTFTLEITPEMAKANIDYENNLSVVKHRSFHPYCGEYTFTGTKAEYEADRKLLDSYKRF